MAELPKEAVQMMRAEFRIPSITGYNRLEPQPRSGDPSANLAAAVYDPLWMLSRQWQFGEFTGEDAGSPISARILGQHTPMVSIRDGDGNYQPYDLSVPLETLVEAEAIPDSLDLAIQIARHYSKLLVKNLLPATTLGLLIGKYGLKYLPNQKDTDGNQLNAAVKNRLFDGCAMLRELRTATSGGNAFSDWVKTTVPLADQPKVISTAGDLAAWFNRTYSQPADGQPNQAWQPSKLEYSFDLGSVPVGNIQTILSAEQFAGGHLDWYSFDFNTLRVRGNNDGFKDAPAPNANLVSFIPSPVKFKGMPNPRYWMFEDSQTDFGKIDTSTTGLLHLLLAEFGLIYGNDWFMLPYPQPINTICSIAGLIVTDTFGEQVLVDAAGAGEANSWQKWAMFHQSDLSAQRLPNKVFYLAPVVDSSLNNDPLEEVNYLRDQVASMVWAVETRVPSQSGRGIPGNQLGFREIQAEPAVANDAGIKYILGTTVPDNWIPFIPVHMEGSVTEIRFQRAKMPGSLGPFGVLVKEKVPPYFINEEEITRSGVIIQRKYRRCRWLDGVTRLWIGREKITGSGEGWSRLQFDQIVSVPAKTS